MLTKLSTFRGTAPDGEPLVRLFHQGDSVTKVAGAFMPEVQEWLGSYKSDLKKIALLVNALGGSEYWGQNVNGDVFPWSALTHDCTHPAHQPHPYDTFAGKVIPPYGYKTFLEAHPFVHHRNKDPRRAFGEVALSCLNHSMKRVELVVLIDRERAALYDAQPFVDRIDNDDYPDVSMGCRVPYDVCTICGHKSKTKDDYCDHVKLLGMNRILDDGRRVGVRNLWPRFFDISFVFIGADRTAKTMCKLASGIYVPQSIADAEEVYGMRDEPSLVKAAFEKEAISDELADWATATRSGVADLVRHSGASEDTKRRAAEKEVQTLKRWGNRYERQGRQPPSELFPPTRGMEALDLFDVAQGKKSKPTPLSPMPQTKGSPAAPYLAWKDKFKRRAGSDGTKWTAAQLAEFSGQTMRERARWSRPKKAPPITDDVSGAAQEAAAGAKRTVKGGKLPKWVAPASAVAGATLLYGAHRLKKKNEAPMKKEASALATSWMGNNEMSANRHVRAHEDRFVSKGERLLDELEPSKMRDEVVNDEFNEKLRAALAAYVMEEQKKIEEGSRRDAAFGDGVLRTNSADTPDVMDPQKEAAFKEVLSACGRPDEDKTTSYDREGVDHGFSVVRDGVTGKKDELTPSGVPKMASVSSHLKRMGIGAALVGAPSAYIAHQIAPKDRKRLEALQAGAVGGLSGAASGLALESAPLPIWGLTAATSLPAASVVREAGKRATKDVAKTASVKKLQAPPHRKEYPYAGQYKWNGMTILVENAVGTWRRGEHWKTKMKNDYGEIKGSLGADGDPVDVYMGPNEKAKSVYIVHQNHIMGPKKGEYDEDKVMLGFASAAQAKRAYMAHYDKPERFFRSITEMALPQFKKMIFRGEADGEKIAAASTEVGMEKVAVDLKLEDLFNHGNTRRERVWKDKVTGESTYHTGSGLGTSFDTMQKTAQADDELAALFKISGDKSAADKMADVIKEIDPDVVTGRVADKLTEREGTIPAATLNSLPAAGLEKVLSTLSGMGIVLKPEEFQRALLSAAGKSDVADDLDAKRTTFSVRSGGPSIAPCGPLGAEHFSKDLMHQLLPLLEGRSYLGPVVNRRIVRISIMPKMPEPPKGEDSPLLTKVGAAYNWYRTEMMKVAAHAAELVAQHPALSAEVFGVDESDLFSKNAGVDANTLGAVAVAAPLALMYSAAARRDIEQGEDAGLLKKLIADHPYLAMLGTGAAARELMKNPDVNRIVGNVAREAAAAGKRIVSGGA